MSCDVWFYPPGMSSLHNRTTLVELQTSLEHYNSKKIEVFSLPLSLSALQTQVTGVTVNSQSLAEKLVLTQLPTAW